MTTIDHSTWFRYLLDTCGVRTVPCQRSLNPSAEEDHGIPFSLKHDTRCRDREGYREIIELLESSTSVPVDKRPLFGAGIVSQSEVDTSQLRLDRSSRRLFATNEGVSLATKKATNVESSRDVMAALVTLRA